MGFACTFARLSFGERGRSTHQTDGLRRFACKHFLARHLLRSPGGTPEFNAELAKMHWLAVPVIMVPSMAMMMVVFWKLMGGLTRLTGLTTDDIFRTAPAKK